MRISKKAVNAMVDALKRWAPSEPVDVREWLEANRQDLIDEFYTAGPRRNDLSIKAYARLTDPDTSKEAAADLNRRMKRMKEIIDKIVMALPTVREVKLGLREPMNSYEISEATDEDSGCARPRLGPLERVGTVVVIDRVKRVGGKPCQRYALDDRGVAYRETLLQSAPV